MTEELWKEGDHATAHCTAAPESMHVNEIEDDVLPKGWRLMLFHELGPHGAAIYAVAGPQESAMVLSHRPEGYARFAEDAGLSVGSADKAIAVAEFFLDKTRNLRIHQYFLHGASDAQLSRFGDASKAKGQIASIVKKPSVKETRKRYRVVAYIQRADKIERWRGTVTDSGKVDGVFTTVIRELPVDFLRH